MHDERRSEDPEAPEADAIEQAEPVRPDEERPTEVGDREANEADVIEQGEPAGGDDDEEEYG